MFKNLKEKSIFIGVALIGVALVWIVARFWVVIPLSLGIIAGTLYYAHKHLEGGLPTPWQVFKTRWLEDNNSNLKKDQDEKK